MVWAQGWDSYGDQRGKQSAPGQRWERCQAPGRTLWVEETQPVGS